MPMRNCADKRLLKLTLVFNGIWVDKALEKRYEADKGYLLTHRDFPKHYLLCFINNLFVTYMSI